LITTPLDLVRSLIKKWVYVLKAEYVKKHQLC
jgi:hypothetical protein